MKASVGKRVLMFLENASYPDDDRVRCEADALVEAGYQVCVIGPADPGQRRYDVLNGVIVRRFRWCARSERIHRLRLGVCLFVILHVCAIAGGVDA